MLINAQWKMYNVMCEENYSIMVVLYCVGTGTATTTGETQTTL